MKVKVIIEFLEMVGGGRDSAVLGVGGESESHN